MSTVILQLPEGRVERVRALAAAEGTTVDQFLASAAAERLSALLTLKHFQQRAARARRPDFERFLSLWPAVPPDEADRI